MSSKKGSTGTRAEFREWLLRKHGMTVTSYYKHLTTEERLAIQKEYAPKVGATNG